MMLPEDERDHSAILLRSSVLPIQPLPRGAQAIGERRLLLAILEDAIRCFQTYLFARETRGRVLFREAEQWLASEDRDLFSFETICEVLGIDPQQVRRGLHRWRDRQLEGVAQTSDST